MTDGVPFRKGFPSVIPDNTLQNQLGEYYYFNPHFKKHVNIALLNILHTYVGISLDLLFLHFVRIHAGIRMPGGEAVLF